MYQLYNPYIWLLFFTAGLYVALALTTRQRHSAIGANTFAWLLTMAAIWPLGYALELASIELAHKILWTKVQYLGIVSIAPLWLMFVSLYVGRAEWLTRRNGLLLLFGSLFTLLLVWTNEYHHLFWRELLLVPDSSLSLLQKVYGPYFWLHLSGSYSLVLLGVLLLVWQFIYSSILYRRQIIALLAGILAPLLLNALSLTPLNPWLNFNPTPLAFLFSSFAATWGLLRFQLLDMKPLARHTILESMTDGVLVLNSQHRIVDINPAAKSILGAQDDPIGQPITALLPTYLSFSLSSTQANPTCHEIILTPENNIKQLEVKAWPLVVHQQKVSGQILVLHDISERKQAEREREELIGQLREALFQTQALYRSARTMIAFENLPTVLQAVVDGVASALRAYQVTFVTIDLDERRVVYFTKAGAGSDHLEAPTYADLAKGLTGWVVRTQQLARVPKHSPKTYRLVQDGMKHLNGSAPISDSHTGSMMVAPVIYRGTVLGAMSATNRFHDRNFSERDGQLLMAMASQAAVAIANARLFREVQKRAVIDDLTQLYNRRHFFSLAEKEFRRALHTNQPLSAIMFDIDHFKKFNDTYGHAIGDDVLRAVAQTISRHLRGNDIVGRYGGEEFAIILPHAPLATAYIVAERLRQRIESTAVETIYGSLTVTISLGVADLSTSEATTVEELFDSADMAMYLAKEAGRNCVATGALV